jgi:superfamily II DNA or RNA helicase
MVESASRCGPLVPDLKSCEPVIIPLFMSSSSTGTTKKAFPKAMAFRGSWRTYQARLLDRLDAYLDDSRFHLVAAPGSGKTILGLEVIRRINRPTLVLAPTITIREQWADRLVDHFLPGGEERPTWVSTDLKAPAALTIATYQALHSLCSGELDKEPQSNGEENSDPAPERINHDFTGDGQGEPEGTLPQVLVAAGFRTLVVDEAHHLRAEWWKTLTLVAERLDHLTIIALTATPPYDVSPFEWQRYEELCGPVDAEVSVPELVLQGDLCPHQDYVYFSTPSEKEQQTLSDFRAAVDLFVHRLRSSVAFKAALLTHPWMLFPDTHVEELLSNPQYLASMVVFLQAVGAKVSPEVLRVMGLPHERIPALDLEWLEILLSNCLYADAKSFRESEEVLKSFRHELVTIGATEHHRVRLCNPSDQARLLTTSVTKLRSVEEVVRLETLAMADDLRCVVLTDFIRKSEMPSQDGEMGVFEDIGVVPIFESLRRAGLKNVRLGVLSGSMVLVPATCEEVLRAAAAAVGVRSEDIFLTPLRHDHNYLIVELRGKYYQGTVRLITSVFEQGGITVLVGTKSLLGEGWDAPCINTLILASFVGSFVLSNQMRGRSIRVDPNRLEKTANIWHLVCLEPGEAGPGEDYRLLVRRCSGFVGVDGNALEISNGTARLGFGDPPFTREQIAQINSDTRRRALDRAALRQRWRDALAVGEKNQMAHGLKAPRQILPRGFVLANTTTSVLVQAGSLFTAIFLEAMRNPAGVGSAQDLLAYTGVVAGVSAAVTLPWTLRSLWRLMHHGTPAKSLRQIGRVVVDSLILEGSIHRGADHGEKWPVYSGKDDDGSVSCWIDGKGHEQSIFLRALSEVLGPIENPRYLLASRRQWPWLREDYFAVPEVFGRKQECAEIFARKWRSVVGPVDLVHTRTPEGRKLLLRARVHSLAAAFQKPSERVSCWK